jgi:hypothetical protein
VGNGSEEGRRWNEERKKVPNKLYNNASSPFLYLQDRWAVIGMVTGGI